MASKIPHVILMEICQLYDDVLVVLAQRLEKQACDWKVVGSIPWNGRINWGWERESCPEQPPACECDQAARKKDFFGQS